MAKVPVVAAVGVLVTVITEGLLTVGVIKEADVPVVPLVVLAVACDSVVNVVGVVALSTTYMYTAIAICLNSLTHLTIQRTQ